MAANSNPQKPVEKRGGYQPKAHGPAPSKPPAQSGPKPVQKKAE